MVSRRFNLKFENLPLSVMYYGGGWVVELVVVGWNLINPPKNFKMYIGPR